MIKLTNTTTLNDWKSVTEHAIDCFKETSSFKSLLVTAVTAIFFAVMTNNFLLRLHEWIETEEYHKAKDYFDNYIGLKEITAPSPLDGRVKACFDWNSAPHLAAFEKGTSTSDALPLYENWEKLGVDLTYSGLRDVFMNTVGTKEYLRMPRSVKLDQAQKVETINRIEAFFETQLNVQDLRQVCKLHAAWTEDLERFGHHDLAEDARLAWVDFYARRGKVDRPVTDQPQRTCVSPSPVRRQRTLNTILRPHET